MRFAPTKQGEQLLKEYAQSATLIIPAVSTGNVAQLSIDALLATLPSVLLGSLHSTHLLPCVGSERMHTDLSAALQKERARLTKQAGGEKRKQKAVKHPPPPHHLVTPLQLFLLPTLRCLVLQQRSPCMRGHHAAFVDELLGWACSFNFSQLIVLTSSPAYRQGQEMLDVEESSGRMGFCVLDESGRGARVDESETAASGSRASSSSSNNASSSSSLRSLLSSALHWHSLQATSLEQDAPPLALSELNGAEHVDDDEETGVEDTDAEGGVINIQPIPVPGFGITRNMFLKLSASSTSPSPGSSSSSSSSRSFMSVFLHTYVDEGSNDRDALIMAHNLYTMLFLQRQQQSTQQQSNKQSSTSTSTSTPAISDSEAAGTMSDSELVASLSASLHHPRQFVLTPPDAWSTVFGNEPDEGLYL